MVRLSLPSLRPFGAIKAEGNTQTDCGSLRGCRCTHWSLRKGADMPKSLVCLVLLSVTIAATALYDSGTALATEAEGYQTTSLALGHFREIEVTSTFRRGGKTAGDEQAWQSQQQAKGSSDVYVQSNVWAPGGSTGWHSHPGHSLIIVTAGTVTDYEGHDPDCRPHVYTKGMGFVDPGGEHVHNLRNEGDVEARTIAVQFIPADAARRIDVADPGTCHFHR
jgi:quercetin dioxygenase-like cupin family protein